MVMNIWLLQTTAYLWSVMNKKLVCTFISHRTDAELDHMTYQDSYWDEFHTPAEVREEIDRRSDEAEEQKWKDRIITLEKEVEILKENNNNESK